MSKAKTWPLYKGVPNEKRWTKVCFYVLVFQVLDAILETPIYPWEILIDFAACYGYASLLWGRPRFWWEKESKKKEAA